jgi:hypothetical protein
MIPRPSICLMFCCTLLLSLLGCGPSYHVGEVDGVLLVNDKPAPKVQIQFMPDIDAKTTGPVSFGETDAQGKFSLNLRVPNSSSNPPGAVVGSHRVVLTDMQLVASATGVGVPIRFGPEYTAVSSTPLKQVVKEGKQTIELKVP